MTYPNTPPLPTLDVGTITRSTIRSGWCGRGVDDPGHRAASCSPFSWSPSKPGWIACKCTCHDDDLADPELVVQLVAEAYAKEYPWRAEYAGVVTRKRPAAAPTTDVDSDVEDTPRPKAAGRRATIADVELRTFVVREIELDPSASVWQLIRTFRASGGSVSNARLKAVFDDVRAGR
jgi:hypothetical protein